MLPKVDGIHEFIFDEPSHLLMLATTIISQGALKMILMSTSTPSAARIDKIGFLKKNDGIGKRLGISDAC